MLEVVFNNFLDNQAIELFSKDLREEKISYKYDYKKLLLLSVLFHAGQVKIIISFIKLLFL